MSLLPLGEAERSAGQVADEPRASCILPAGTFGLTGELWMGGAESATGMALHPEDLAGAWLLDCAGEMPAAYRTAAALTLPCVFADLESLPAPLERIERLAADLASLLLGRPPSPAWCGLAPPLRLYVMCQQGLNRSGLLAALILRATGIDAKSAIDRIRACRPGSLTNQTFVHWIERGSG